MLVKSRHPRHEECGRGRHSSLPILKLESLRLGAADEPRKVPSYCPFFFVMTPLNLCYTKQGASDHVDTKVRFVHRNQSRYRNCAASRGLDHSNEADMHHFARQRKKLVITLGGAPRITRSLSLRFPFAADG